METPRLSAVVEVCDGDHSTWPTSTARFTAAGGADEICLPGATAPYSGRRQPAFHGVDHGSPCREGGPESNADA